MRKVNRRGRDGEVALTDTGNAGLSDVAEKTMCGFQVQCSAESVSSMADFVARKWDTVTDLPGDWRHVLRSPQVKALNQAWLEQAGWTVLWCLVCSGGKKWCDGELPVLWQQ